MLGSQNSQSSSSDVIEEGVALVVAIVYPIQEITPKTPPTIISTDNCKTIGLHSDNIKRYAYTKKPIIHNTKMVIPVAARFDIALQV